MRIGVVVPGGVDRSGTHRVIPALLWLLERLAKTHDMQVFALRQEPRPAEYDLVGCRVTNTGAPPVHVRTLIAVARAHRARPFDVFHGVWATGPGVIAGALGRRFGRPTLLHVAGGELTSIPELRYGGLRTVLRGRAVRWALGAATRITGASTAILEEVAALGHHAHELPLGVAADRWPRRTPAARRPGAPARLLHVGSLNTVKDLPTLLRAVRTLVDEGRDVRLDQVGEDTLRGEVQRLTGELSLTEHVRFHGFLPHDRVRPLMERADLLVVSSRHEAGPVAVLEAAVAGVPVVGTAVGHVRDWAPEAARAVPVGDHCGLARAIAAVLDDEECRVRMATKAQTRAMDRDADWTASEVLRHYGELVRRHQS